MDCRRRKGRASDNWRLCEHGTLSEVHAVRDAQDDLAFMVVRLALRTLRLVGVMDNLTERNWTAHVVISSDHAGLRPYFKLLEAEMLRVLARVDDPRDVKRYLVDMVQHSKRYAEGTDRPKYR